MAKHREARRLPFSAVQMFDLVSDIGRYPEFLPWIMAMRIRSTDVVGPTKILTADMVVGFKMVREQFTSRVSCENTTHIHVQYLDGPLKYLHNDWWFRDVEGGCEIDFAVEFEFKSKVFERLAGMFFGDALSRMVASFEKRAHEIYDMDGWPGLARA